MVEEEKKERPALWHDSDDEEVRVNLKQIKRNRKLREDWEEIAISGAEFSKRLRTKYAWNVPSNIGSILRRKWTICSHCPKRRTPMMMWMSCCEQQSVLSERTR